MMSWTGHHVPEWLTVRAVYERGRLVRRTTTAEDNGGVNITDVRCSCQYPEAGCCLHGGEPKR